MIWKILIWFEVLGCYHRQDVTKRFRKGLWKRDCPCKHRVPRVKLTLWEIFNERKSCFCVEGERWAFRQNHSSDTSGNWNAHVDYVTTNQSTRARVKLSINFQVWTRTHLRFGRISNPPWCQTLGWYHLQTSSNLLKSFHRIISKYGTTARNDTLNVSLTLPAVPRNSAVKRNFTKSGILMINA